MKIVIISDTHNFHYRVDLPDGDLIIHCGDLTGMGTKPEVANFIDWFEKLPYQHKIFIAGNHDFGFERETDWLEGELDHRNFNYLHDNSIEIEGIKFYGSPYQPWFCDWAFNLKRGEACAAKWAEIPQDTDFLITHGPPEGILDKNLEGESVGCYDLLQRVKVVKPIVHAFGHIHEGYGSKEVEETLFINASTCTRAYKPTNKPVVIELNKKEVITYGN